MQRLRYYPYALQKTPMVSQRAPNWTAAELIALTGEQQLRYARKLGAYSNGISRCCTTWSDVRKEIEELCGHFAALHGVSLDLTKILERPCRDTYEALHAHIVGTMNARHGGAGQALAWMVMMMLRMHGFRASSDSGRKSGLRSRPWKAKRDGHWAALTCPLTAAAA